MADQNEVVILGNDGTEHVFPAGFDPQKAAAIVRGQSAAPAQHQPSLVDRAVDALPMLGGMAGGLTGGAGGTVLGFGVGGVPGAIGGAALGGGAGEAAKQLINRFRGAQAPASATDAALGIGWQAAMQGGMEAAGGLVGAGLKAVAPKIAEVALNPAKAIAQKVSNLGEVYVREGRLLPRLRGGVGAIGKRESAAQAGALRSASRAATDQLVEGAELAGAPPIQGSRVIRGIQRIADRASTYGDTGAYDASGDVIQRGQDFLAKNPTINLTKGLRMRRVLESQAEPVFKAAQRGMAPQGAVVGAEVDQALSQGLRRELQDAVPGLKESSTRTRELANLEKALKDAALRKHILTKNMGLAAGVASAAGGLATGDPSTGAGAGLGTLGAYWALSNPRMLGRAALASNGVGRFAESVAPSLARTALIAKLLGQPAAAPEE